MSSWLDGLSNIYSITARINALKNQANSSDPNLNTAKEYDPDEMLYALEQNFSQMLDNLISSNKDEEEEKEKSDPLAFLFNNAQTSSSTSALENYLNISSYTGKIDGTVAGEDTTQYDPLLTQYKLNLDNII